MNFENILFIDIETVSQYKKYEEWKKAEKEKEKAEKKALEKLKAGK